LGAFVCSLQFRPTTTKKAKFPFLLTAVPSPSSPFMKPRSKFILTGLPFVLLAVGGAYGLSFMVQEQYDARDRKQVMSGKKPPQPTEKFSLQEEYEVAKRNYFSLLFLLIFFFFLVFAESDEEHGPELGKQTHSKT
jgi:hypothetical protein